MRLNQGISDMRYDRLVAPSVSLLAVVLLLLAARTYDAWPVKAPQCSLRTLTGVPCVGCGGTRAMKALSRGELGEAAGFNPLVVLAVAVIVLWFVWTVSTIKLARYQTGAGGGVSQTASKPGKWWGVVISVLLLLNWLYLLCYLPR